MTGRPRRLLVRGPSARYAQGERAAWWPVITNVGILLVLVGLPGNAG